MVCVYRFCILVARQVGWPMTVGRGSVQTVLNANAVTGAFEPTLLDILAYQVIDQLRKINVPEPIQLRVIGRMQPFSGPIVLFVTELPLWREARSAGRGMRLM